MKEWILQCPVAATIVGRYTSISKQHTSFLRFGGKMPNIGFTGQSSVCQTLFCSEWCLWGISLFFSLLLLEVGNILWLVSLHSMMLPLSESYSEVTALSFISKQPWDSLGQLDDIRYSAHCEVMSEKSSVL